MSMSDWNALPDSWKIELSGGDGAEIEYESTKYRDAFTDSDIFTIASSTGQEVQSATIKFDDASSDIWLDGLADWNKVSIDTGDGDHAILIGRLGADGAQISLHDGNSAALLGTLDDDSRTEITGSHGNFRIKANGLATVNLKDGDHVIDVGSVHRIAVGEGDSNIAFTCASSKTTKISADGGNHSIIGMGAGQDSKVEIALGDAPSRSSVTLLGTFGDVKVKSKGAGEQEVWIENTAQAEVSLKAAGDKKVLIESVLGDGAQVELGDGDHVIALGSRFDDTKTKIHVEDGNSRISVAGVHEIEAGKGDHVIVAGDAGRITTDEGSQRILFADGNDKAGAKIETKGGGDDLIAGIATGSGALAEVKSHDGDDQIVIIGDGWSSVKIDGGRGVDTLFVDARIDIDALELKGIEQIIRVDSTGSIADALDSLGIDRSWLDAAETVDTPLVKTFDLLPTPDPAGPDAFDLLLDDAPFSNANDEGREDRLMEPTDILFDRMEAYERTFEQSFAADEYDEVEHNRFGDLSGTNGDDDIVDSGGSNSIFAMAGDDTVQAGDGHDFVFGGAGADVLDGGDGNDLLDGGAGADVLRGGAGIDVFVFRKGDGLTDIQDFELSHDILDVEGFDNLTYQALTLAGRQVGDDVHYDFGDDMLILRGVVLETMVEIDLCIK